MSKPNRTRRMDKRDRKRERVKHGEMALSRDRKKEFERDYTLDWFVPQGMQRDCIESFENHTFTIVDGRSGCGKTSTAIWWALNQIKRQHYDQMVFIKNPTEAGDDQIGFLSGSETDKLKAHFDTTRRIFHEFMAKNKLENDEANDKIRLVIPSFLLGATFDNAIVLIDEAQVMSPSTIKLLTERCGVNTKYIILGDSGQRYSVRKRADGFKDLIERTTIDHKGLHLSKCEPMLGYVKLPIEDNMRSAGSEFINRLYDN